MNLLEHESGNVLGPVDVTDLGVGGHDHAARAVAAGQPGAVVVLDGTVLVVGHVLAEVPDGAVVGLGEVVGRHLEDLAVAVGHELRHHGLDVGAVPADHAGLVEQRDLVAERDIAFGAELHRLLDGGDREERVGDVRRVRERRDHRCTPERSVGVRC